MYIVAKIRRALEEEQFYFHMDLCINVCAHFHKLYAYVTVLVPYCFILCKTLTCEIILYIVRVQLLKQRLFYIYIFLLMLLFLNDSNKKLVFSNKEVRKILILRQ